MRRAASCVRIHRLSLSRLWRAGHTSRKTRDCRHAEFARATVLPPLPGELELARTEARRKCDPSAVSVNLLPSPMVRTGTVSPHVSPLITLRVLTALWRWSCRRHRLLAARRPQESPTTQA